MSDKSAIAVNMFNKGFNCAQSVFYAFCTELGIDEDAALKIACGLGAGMARAGEVCGAVTGGILVLGMLHGRGKKDKRTAMELTYQKTHEFMKRFAEANGSCVCRELLKGCALTTEEGQNKFKDAGMFEKVCVPCVKSAVGILDNLK